MVQITCQSGICHSITNKLSANVALQNAWNSKYLGKLKKKFAALVTRLLVFLLAVTNVVIISLLEKNNDTREN